VVLGVGCAGRLLLLPSLGYHAPGGRVSTWYLRDGTRVRFFKREHDPPGRDTVKVLEATRPGGEPREYPFAVWHTAYKWVELRADAEQRVIWVVDTGSKRVGCSLELDTGRVTDEGGSHPRGVGLSSGQVVARE
jgi:hypothetical protein